MIVTTVNTVVACSVVFFSIIFAKWDGVLGAHSILSRLTSIHKYFQPDAPGEPVIDHNDAFKIWYRVICLLRRKEWYYLSWVIIATLISAGCNFLLPIAVGKAINLAQTEDLLHDETSTQTLLFIGLGALLKSIVEYIREAYGTYVGEIVKIRARALYFSNILLFETSFFDNNHPSELNAHYTYLDGIHYLAGRQIPRILYNVLSLTIVCVYMLHVSPIFGFIALTLLFIQVVIIKYLDKSIYKHLLRVKRVEKAYNQLREETFSNIRTVKHFGCERKLSARFELLLDDDQIVRKDLIWLRSMRSAVIKLFHGLTASVTLYVGLNGTRR